MVPSAPPPSHDSNNEAAKSYDLSGQQMILTTGRIASAVALDTNGTGTTLSHIRK